MRSHILLTFFILAAALPTGAIGQTGQPFTTEDALNVASASIEATTEDGRYVAMTRWTQRDRKNVDHMRFGDPTYIAPSFAELLVVDAMNGTSVSVFGTKVQVRAFHWSPNGQQLAFLLLQGDRYVLHVYDRTTSQVKPVSLDTGLAIASNSPVTWRPDGSGVLVALRPENWAAGARAAYLALTDGPTIVQDSREPFLAWDAVRNRSQQMIPAIADVTSGAVRMLTDGPVPAQGFTQSEDGGHLSFLAVVQLKTSYTRRDGAEYSVETLNLNDGTRRVVRSATSRELNIDWNRSGTAFAYAEEGAVFVQGIGDSTATRVTPEADPATPDSARTRFSVSHWRADGGALLLSSDEGYHVADLASGTMDLVVAAPDDKENAPTRRPVSWSPDGRYVYFTHSAADRWERGLLRFDLRTRAMDELVMDSSLYGSWHFARNGGRILYSFSDGDLPEDLFSANADFSRTVRLTELNPWLADRQLTRSELVRYLDADGNTLNGILYYPVNYDSTRQYPLVAEIYERFFDNGFNHRMNLLANEGFFGFRPSVDLEIGYPGEAWLKGVTAGINTLIERGLVDKDKLGVHGTSYGGYATNLLITQTGRFAAAINISGKVNIISFLGDSPKITVRNYHAAENGQDRIGATLWEQPQKYIAHSAIMNADRITTPLLLMSGEGDWNVPATNQREMYYALRRLGKEVVWVHYMNAGHGAGRSSTAEDFHDHWRRILGWYNEHFFPGEEKVTTDTGH